MADTAENVRTDASREERKHPNLSVDTKEAHKYQSFQNPSNNTFSHWREIRAMGKLPSRRSYHCSGYYKEELFIYGGEDIREGIASDMYKINVEKDSDVIEWSLVETSGESPEGLSHHTGIVFGEKWYIFGGNRKDGAEVGWVYIFDFAESTWTCIKSENGPILDDHSATLYEKGDEASMIVFGGFHSGTRVNKVYKFCLKSHQWSVLSEGSEEPTSDLPVPRSGHAAVVSGSKMFLFGGCDEDLNKLNDLWSFDLASNRWAAIDPRGDKPEPRTGHTLVANQERIFLFGGILNITHELNDLFVFHVDKIGWTMFESETSGLDPAVSPTIKISKHELSLKKSHHESDEQKSPIRGAGGLGVTGGLHPKRVEPGSPMKSPGKSPTRSPGKRYTMKKKDKKSEKAGNDGELSPTTAAMKNSILLKADEHNQGLLSRKKRTTLQIEGPGEPISGRIQGKKPCARDGHTAMKMGDKMIIFGGDRHHMPFNDLYSFQMFQKERERSGDHS